LNVEVASVIFEEEPIKIFVPPTANISRDLLLGINEVSFDLCEDSNLEPEHLNIPPTSRWTLKLLWRKYFRVNRSFQMVL